MYISSPLSLPSETWRRTRSRIARHHASGQGWRHLAGELTWLGMEHHRISGGWIKGVKKIQMVMHTSYIYIYVPQYTYIYIYICTRTCIEMWLQHMWTWCIRCGIYLYLYIYIDMWEIYIYIDKYNWAAEGVNYWDLLGWLTGPISSHIDFESDVRLLEIDSMYT